MGEVVRSPSFPGNLFPLSVYTKVQLWWRIELFMRLNSGSPCSPKSLLHPYLQCVHPAATVAKVGPLAMVSGLLITYEGRLN